MKNAWNDGGVDIFVSIKQVTDGDEYDAVNEVMMMGSCRKEGGWGMKSSVGEKMRCCGMALPSSWQWKKNHLRFFACLH